MKKKTIFDIRTKSKKCQTVYVKMINLDKCIEQMAG